MNIAVDAFGGDHAPDVAIEGACLACQNDPDLQVTLVGKESVLRPKIKQLLNVVPSNLHIEDARDVIEMSDEPVAALRKKKQSSLAVCADLVKAGKADAMVSAGNTGAAVAVTTLKWRMLKGIERAGIALPVPNKDGVSVLLDAGANISCKPIHFYHYAVMGSIYAQDILGLKNARVGLLNVGEEESKGGDAMKEIHGLLKTAPCNFIGNVEGRDLFNGQCDVVVCDGFVGNIVLKVSEGAAQVIGQITKRAMKSSWLSMIGAFLCKGAFQKIKKDIDYSEYGGAPLLGVNGVCIIGHGSSSAKAIKNAIRVATEMVNDKVNQQILEKLEEHVPS